MASKTANDKNGAPLYIGDEITCRAKVTEVSDGHVLTNSVEFPHREMWFQGSLIERTEQGSASKDADRRVGVGGAAPAAPAPTAIAAPSEGSSIATAVAEPAEPTPRELAIAFAMSKGYKDRAAAEKIVDEHGWRYILADRDEEEAAKKAQGANAAAAPEANQAATDEAAKPGSPA